MDVWQARCWEPRVIEVTKPSPNGKALRSPLRKVVVACCKQRRCQKGFEATGRKQAGGQTVGFSELFGTTAKEVVDYHDGDEGRCPLLPHLGWRHSPPHPPSAPVVSPSRQVGRRHSQLHSGEVAARGEGDTCRLQQRLLLLVFRLGGEGMLFPGMWP
ncbi:hypothetical protein E2C01_044029 [Portunus trituberculatus]|uniref:Uncharacterized protein n=1 Tax=Portunus trituberculatus TaxID=210409 RepID=A0A5B7FX98_PORTR|nr:hypothetical protein [Portunus trituberculatus]